MSRWSSWIVDRLGIEPIRSTLLDRRVPALPWYHGDGFTLLVLLSILVLTGMFMTLTYAPSPDTAHESVRFITEQQTMGWFVRALHYWSAGMMVGMTFFHLVRIILVSGYRSPREGTYLVGVFMLFVVLLMAITGYMLRWDERGLYAVKVVLYHLGNVPWIGNHLVILAQGGQEIGARTLTRIYSIHVIFVPLLLLAMLGIHMYLVILKGVTSRAERRRPVHSKEEQERLYDEEINSENGEPYFPDAFLGTTRLASFVIATVLLLTIFVGPRALQPEASLTATAFPAEEWWFWWYSALIAITPSWLAPIMVVALPIVVFLFLAALPFLDNGPRRGIRARPYVAVSVAACVVILLGLTNYRYFSPWTGWPRSDPPEIPPGIELSPAAEQGRGLFATYGCNSCHAVSGDGARVAIDLAERNERMTAEELEMYILSPPDDIPMPGYEGRISEEELHQLVQFVLIVQTFPRR